MKHLKLLLVAAVLVIAGTQFSEAQSKIAHINTEELIKAMPETKAAVAELEKLQKTYEAEIQTLNTELQNKVKQYDAEASTKTDEENASRIQEVQEFDQRIRAYQGNAQQEMQKKQIDLLQPVSKKAKEAILKVAKAQGFDYVLDSSNGSSVILADGKDLMADVKTELGF
jgi:outer membrane protein